MTMTLITWLREEKAATEQTSICQLRCRSGMPNSPPGSGTDGADAAGQGWELSSTTIWYWAVAVRSGILIIRKKLPWFFPSHIAAIQPIEQKLPHTPCTAKPNWTETTKHFFWVIYLHQCQAAPYKTSQGFLHSSFWINIFEACYFHSFYFPTSVSFVLGNTLFTLTQSTI